MFVRVCSEYLNRHHPVVVVGSKASLCILSFQSTFSHLQVLFIHLAYLVEFQFTVVRYNVKQNSLPVSTQLSPKSTLSVIMQFSILAIAVAALAAGQGAFAGKSPSHPQSSWAGLASPCCPKGNSPAIF